MDAPTDPAKLRAVLERLEAEEARRLAEKIEAGEVVRVPLYIPAGSEAEALARVEEAKADKLAELRAAGETREVAFAVTIVVTGVRRPGEAPSGPAWKPAASPGRCRDAAQADERGMDNIHTPSVAEDPPPPLLESYVYTTIRNASDETGDPGQILEGWWSIDAGVLMLTGADGKHITSRAMIPGEDPKALARSLLREKQPSDFQRPLSYPSVGMA